MLLSIFKSFYEVYDRDGASKLTLTFILVGILGYPALFAFVMAKLASLSNITNASTIELILTWSWIGGYIGLSFLILKLRKSE